LHVGLAAVKTQKKNAVTQSCPDFLPTAEKKRKKPKKKSSFWPQKENPSLPLSKQNGTKEACLFSLQAVGRQGRKQGKRDRRKASLQTTRPAAKYTLTFQLTIVIHPSKRQGRQE